MLGAQTVANGEHIAYPPHESMRPTVLGSKYMVSAGHPLVAQVAARVLQSGGNAVDAGVAAGIAAKWKQRPTLVVRRISPHFRALNKSGAGVPASGELSPWQGYAKIPVRRP
jgi:hypothetical protein